MFAGLTEQTFLSRFGIADPSLVDYLSGLLARFVHADAIHCLPAGHGRPLTSVYAMISEAKALPEGGVTKREYLRHIGDVTLFWTGVFPEALERNAESWGRHAVLNYTTFGKRSYLLASQYENDRFEEEAPVLRRLSHEFELCAVGLREVRRDWEQIASETTKEMKLIQ
jgi:hypothetical protein